MTPLGTHAAQTAALGNHVVTRWEYDDLTTRDAATYAASDIGGIARVGTAAPYRFYSLVATTPLWSEVGALPPEYVDGLVLTRASVSTVTIGTGSCRDSGDTTNLQVASVLTADITSSGADGLDTGSEAADTWYSVWVIGTASGGVASLLSASETAPTLPSGYTLKRRVGWVRNDSSSDFLEGVQTGSGRDRTWTHDETLSSTQVLSGGTATAATDVDCSAVVPPTAKRCTLHVSASALVGVDVRPDGFGNLVGYRTAPGSSSLQEMPCPGQTVEYANALANGSTSISVVAYVDSL